MPCNAIADSNTKKEITATNEKRREKKDENKQANHGGSVIVD